VATMSVAKNGAENRIRDMWLLGGSAGASG
jgi:hypothetical protein